MVTHAVFFFLPQMGIHAGLRVCLTVFFLASGATIGILTQHLLKVLHRKAITTVMRALMSFFETTPLGQIVNSFSKDIDTIDNTVFFFLISAFIFCNSSTKGEQDMVGRTRTGSLRNPNKIDEWSKGWRDVVTGEDEKG